MSARWAPGTRCCRSDWCCSCCRPPPPTCPGRALRRSGGRGSASLHRSPPLPPPRRSSSRSPGRNTGRPASPWPGPLQRSRPAPERRKTQGSMIIITAAGTGWSSGSGATSRPRTSSPFGYWWPAWPRSVSVCVFVCVCFPAPVHRLELHWSPYCSWNQTGSLLMRVREWLQPLPESPAAEPRATKFLLGPPNPPHFWYSKHWCLNHWWCF